MPNKAKIKRWARHLHFHSLPVEPRHVEYMRFLDVLQGMVEWEIFPIDAEIGGAWGNVLKAFRELSPEQWRRIEGAYLNAIEQNKHFSA